LGKDTSVSHAGKVTIALVGMSGAGKTACLTALGACAHDAEMDRGLETGTPQKADAMLAWIVRSPSWVVATSVHRDGLREIAALKKTDGERFDCIYFVYLFCKKEELEKRLGVPGSGRSVANIQGALTAYNELDDILKKVMDEYVDTTSLSMPTVAAKVREIAKRVGAYR
jgi:hypothetical protein